MSWWFWIFSSPLLTSQLLLSVDELVEQYPPELVLNWNGTDLNANLSPVIFSMPTTLPNQDSVLPNNLLIINTNNAPIDQDALWLVTNTSLIMQLEDQSTQPLTLKNIFPQNFTIDRSVIEVFHPQLKAWSLSLMETAKLLALPMIFIYLLLSRLIMLAIESSLVWLLLKFNRIKLQYWKIVQLCLHLFIPAEIVHQVAIRVLPNSPFSFHSLTFWVLLMFILVASLPTSKKN